MTRLRSALRVATRIAPLIGGIAGCAAAVGYVIDGAWEAAVWAGLAAAWAFLCAAHRCPVPAPERGRVSVAFVGGPLDGAEIPMPPVGQMPEMQGIEIEAGGTRYRVESVEHTHYTAEAIR